MTPAERAALLRSERLQWDSFEVLPGRDSLRLLADSFLNWSVDRHELAFLFARTAWRLHEDPDHEEVTDLETAGYDNLNWPHFRGL